MALFTDGSISSAQDLQEYDSSVLTVANAEGIDVAVKMTLAQQDLGNELMLFLFRRARFRDYQPNFTRRTGLTDVVVTDALQQWHVLTTLALVYRVRLRRHPSCPVFQGAALQRCFTLLRLG